MPKSVERDDFIDVLRIVAAVAVVAVHSATTVVGAYGKVSGSEWWLANTIDAASRWAVPIFVMISGAVILDPAKYEGLATFYKKRLKRILLPLAFWIVVYAIANHFFRGDPLSVMFVLKRILFDQPYEHLYF